MTIPVERLFVSPSQSLRELIACIDRGAKGIALVVDDDRHLIGTVTDGDVRRAILAGVSLELAVGSYLNGRPAASTRGPLTAPSGASDGELIGLMNEASIRHIPILDAGGRVVGIGLLGDLVREYELPLRAVVMAGGFGKRLQPLTLEQPKPMLPVGDKPLLEKTIEGLRQAGIRKVNVTTHYLAERISEHFGDGRAFGVEIEYLREDEPLGTAGVLGLLEATDEPLLVVNGDVLTNVNFRAMLDFHREHEADMTVAVREYDVQIPYGVVQSNGSRVVSIQEKPLLRHFINAGIYLINPGVCARIPSGERFDMPDLINRLIVANRPVVSFPIREYWLDIGRVEDYERAVKDVSEGEL
jgi:dTDP-glucose pyrophosphorylase/CBS domain-containing protein